MSRSKPKPVETVDKSVDNYSLILGIRRIKVGAFAGLWELTELDAQHNVKRVITDANARSVIVSLAEREIRKAL